MTGRIIATIILGVAWLSFVILFLAFWANGLSLFQSVAIFIVSILILAGLLSVLWVSWGMKMAKKAMAEADSEEKKPKKK